MYLYKPAFRKNVGFSEFSTVQWCNIKIDMKALLPAINHISMRREILAN